MTGPKSNRGIRPLIVGITIVVQIGFLIFPGLYIADRYHWAILLAPTLFSLHFIGIYLFASLKNPGIIPRSIQFVPNQAQEISIGLVAVSPQHMHPYAVLNQPNQGYSQHGSSQQINHLHVMADHMARQHLGALYSNRQAIVPGNTGQHQNFIRSTTPPRHPNQVVITPQSLRSNYTHQTPSVAYIQAPLPTESQPTIYKEKYCITCRIMRPNLASHCKDCDNCVLEFDHHCFWMGNCVGKGNLREFILMMIGGVLVSRLLFTKALVNVAFAIWGFIDSNVYHKFNEYKDK